MLLAVFRAVLAVFFIVAGVNHFLSPRVYLGLMPPYLPWPLALIYLSGVAEVVLGAAALVSRLRVVAGWGLIALLVAIFPANLHAALHGFRGLPAWVLWVRLPLQLVLIAWVYWCCLSARARAPLAQHATR